MSLERPPEKVVERIILLGQVVDAQSSSEELDRPRRGEPTGHVSIQARGGQSGRKIGADEFFLPAQAKA